MSFDRSQFKRVVLSMNAVTPWRVVWGIAVLLALVPAIVRWGGLATYIMHLIEVSILWALATASLNLLVGYTGPESLGHGALFGIGGFVAAAASMQLGIPMILGIFLGAVISVLVAFLIALPSLRIGGAYFVILTIAFQLIYQDSLLIFDDWTGGLNGLAGIPSLPGIFGLKAMYVDYYVVLALTLVSIFLLYRIVNSGVGDSLQMIKQDEEFAKHLGYNTTRYKIAAFMISAFFTGLAGGLYAQHNTFMGPTLSNIFVSFHLLVYIIVGGAGFFWGPIAAAVGINIAQELTNIAAMYARLLMATLFFLVIMFAPDGISGLVEQWKQSDTDEATESAENPSEETDA